MKRVGFFAGLMLAALALPAAADQCPPLKIITSVEMILDHGQLLVPVTVGDENLYFSIGTATPYSAISAAFVEAHKYPRTHSDVKFVNLSGEISDKMTRVPSFGMGRMKSENFQLLVSDMHEDKMPPGVKHAQGVIGADILRAYDVELDFGAGKFNLISRDHCDGMPVYWPSETIAKVPMFVSDENKIMFNMTLDGHELQTILNTGLRGSTLRLNTAKVVYDIDNDSAGNVPAGKLGDGTPLFAHRFKSLTVDGLDIANPLLLLMPSRADEKMEHLHNIHTSPTRGPMYLQKQPELTLGLAELKHLHVYIDYHHQTIYFTPAATPAASTPTPGPAAP